MIELDKYIEARQEYFNDPVLNENLRFGQFMCDRFDIKEEECPGLFYETSHLKANSMILWQLVDFKE